MCSLKTFLIIASFTAAYAVCPSQWHLYKTNCFFLSKDNETMADAEKMCEIIGKQYGRNAHLATVNDAATDKFLFDLIDANSYSVSYYIGANDIVEEGKFYWAGTALVATYLNWGRNQPNNRWGNENCVAMWGTNAGFVGLERTWADEPCTDLHTYICQMKQLHVGGIVG